MHSKNRIRGTEELPLFEGDLRVYLLRHHRDDGPPCEECVVQVPLKTKNEKGISRGLENLMEGFYLQKQLECSYVAKNTEYIIASTGFRITQEPYHNVLMNLCDGKLSYGEKLMIVNEVAEGLKALKEMGIILRDLSPQTIAVLKKRRNYSIKFLIFRQAKVLTEAKNYMTSESVEQITEFTSPEIRQKKKHSFKCDVWSIGCLLYRLLFGSCAGVYVSGGKVNVHYPEGTPDWMQQILSNMMAQNPQNRYNIEDVLNRMKFLLQCAEQAGKFMPDGF